MRLKACVPEVPFVLLHAINDGTEQWSALRHSPTRTASEIMALGSVFYGNKRALEGVLACLADGIQSQEWKSLGKMWKLSFQPAKGPVGMRVVWSDRAFDAEFDDCVVSKDASSNTLLSELIRFQASVNAIVSVEDAIADKNMPVLILNPEFFPKEELDGLRNRMAHVVELGRGARRPFAAQYIPVPEGTPPFPGMPNNDTCYWKRPLPENMPPEIAFKRAAGSIAWKTSPFTPDTPELRIYGFMLENGRMAIFGRNENDTYISEKYIYKVNNLLNSKGSILQHFIKVLLHNSLFEDTSYTFLGFTGFSGSTIMPVFKQPLIKNAVPATSIEISTYMAALGFNGAGKEGSFTNGEIDVWDVVSRNVLKDIDGDIFVIDAELRLRH
jgi:hypothetical protein